MKPLTHLDWTARLTVSCDKAAATILRQDRVLRVRFSTLSEALSFWRRLGHSARRRWIRRGGEWLQKTGATLRVQVGEEIVVVLGPDVQGGLLEKAVGLFPFRVRWLALARSAAGRTRSS